MSARTIGAAVAGALAALGGLTAVAATSSEAVADRCQTTVTVEPGDTLSGIAAVHGVTVEWLEAHSQVVNDDTGTPWTLAHRDRIYPGQPINIGRCIDDTPQTMPKNRHISRSEVVVEVAGATQHRAVDLDHAWAEHREDIPRTVLSDREILLLLEEAGAGDLLVELGAIALAESAGRLYAVGDIDINYPGDISLGLWQMYFSPNRPKPWVSDDRQPATSLNPREAAAAAVRLAQGGGLDRWTTWRLPAHGGNGKARDYLDRMAQEATSLGL